MLHLCNESETEKINNWILKRRYSQREADDETFQLDKLESKATSRTPKFESSWIERPGTDGEELVCLVEYNCEPITCYEIGEDG